VAIIDHGKVIIQGKPSEIAEKAHSKSLEEAFIKLTGKDIRNEDASSVDEMRMRRKAFGR
jgi:ABC-2 type transport system ATP-binding protein